MVFRRELLIAYRRRGELSNPLVFFLVVVSMFPLGLSPTPGFLAKLAPGIVWVCALLAALLSLDSLFRSDYEDGSLEQMALSPQPLPVMVLAKVAAHWLTTGVPLILMAPVLAAMLNLPDGGFPILMATLTLGTPVLSLVGAIGVALTVGLRKGGALLSLLVLPFYVPVLIFGANAVADAGNGLPVAGQLYLLAAMLVLSLTLAPFATAAALRVSVN